MEPFDFDKANISGTLWFAEGFTSYYTNLILCRAGIISTEQYVEGLTDTFNYVWNSPARELFDLVEISNQAPFVDAATSVDPVNRENTFISYYSYGSMLGLALDLSLRQKNLYLDGYLKLIWNNFGKPEKQYTLVNLQKSLAQYAGKVFANEFFDAYVHKSEMPDYKTLLASVGVLLSQKEGRPYFGVSASLNGDGNGKTISNPKKGSPAYIGELDK